MYYYKDDISFGYFFHVYNGVLCSLSLDSHYCPN